MSSASSEHHSPEAAVLYYDGSCGFCDATVKFVLKHERVNELRFAPLNGASAVALLRRYPRLATIDSVIWVEAAGNDSSERVLVRSDAVLRIARYLGLPRSLLVLGRIVPRALRDRLYDLIARHRKRVLRMPAACDIRLPAVRARFLD